MAVAEKDNNWYIVESRPVIIDGKKDYKQKWIPIPATNKEEADQLEKDFKDNKKKGLKIDPNLTVFKLSEMWMTQHVKSPIKPRAKSTQIFYQSRLDIYINPVIGAMKMGELSVEDLDEVLTTAAEKAEEEEGKVDTTLDSVYSTMSAMFNWAKKKRKIKENLMEFVDAPEVMEREYTLLDEKDIPKLLQAVIMPGKYANKYAQNQRLTYYRMFLTELTSALRIDELCGVMEADIDFELKIYHVRWQVLNPGTNPEFGPAKDRGTKLPDKIPLADMVIDELKQEIKYKAFKKAEAERKGLPWKEHGLVFTNALGGPIDSKKLNTRILKIALEKAELPPMKFHNLRHSVLTILVNNHEDPNAICNLARHKDYNFFKSRYLHPSVESQRPAVQTLEKLVSNAPKPKRKIKK